MKEYINAIKNCLNFEGRANMKDFWMFVFVNFMISLGLALVTEKLKFDYIYYAYAGIFGLISISVGVRRLHDTDKSGWYILIPFYNIFLLLQKGSKRNNQYGTQPINSNFSRHI